MNRLALKILTISFLVLVLLIPLQMVSSIISERQARQSEVLTSIAKVWGNKQNIQGIIINSDKSYIPEQVNIEGRLNASIRKKGIFKIPLYTSYLKINLKVNNSLINRNINEITVLISDPDSVEIENVIINGNKTNFRTSNKYKEIKIFPNQKITSKNILIDLKISGQKELLFSQLANELNIKLDSNWADPSFIGSVLPLNRKISGKGFSSKWYLKNKINSTYKNKSEAVSNLLLNSSENNFGISLFIPADFYLMVERSVKYGILFIFLTFSAFFLFELLTKINIHPLQYTMIGLALTIFYLLLLSLSEHIAFGMSYFIATASTIGLISFYSSKILNSVKRTSICTTLLVLLYSILYVLLQLEELSLLFGSFTLFIVLAFFMITTRNTNWYNIFTTEKLKN